MFTTVLCIIARKVETIQMSFKSRREKVWTGVPTEYFRAIKKKLQVPYAANILCSKKKKKSQMHKET